MLVLMPVTGSVLVLPMIPRDKPLGPPSQWKSTSSFGFLTGNVFSSTASTRLNSAVLAPMPSASESTATAVKALLFSASPAPLACVMTHPAPPLYLEITPSSALQTFVHRTGYSGVGRAQLASNNRHSLI